MTLTRLAGGCFQPLSHPSGTVEQAAEAIPVKLLAPPMPARVPSRLGVGGDGCRHHSKLLLESLYFLPGGDGLFRGPFKDVCVTPCSMGEKRAPAVRGRRCAGADDAGIGGLR